MGINFGISLQPVMDKIYRKTGLLPSKSKERKNAIRHEQASFMGRVDAARAAGIHPVAALGATTGQSPVVSSGSGASEFSYSVEPNPQKDPAIDRYNRARASLAELDLQERQFEASQRRLASQAGNPPASWEVSPGVSGNGQPAIELEPVKLLPQVSPGLTPGVHPGSETWRDPVGGIYQRPAGAQAEQSEVTNIVRDLSTHYGVSFGTALNLALAGLSAYPIGRLGVSAYRSYVAAQAAKLAARREAIAAKKFVHPRNRR